MADINPQMVKQLRDKTGAGMADCKKALVEADGDMNLAIEILRKKGAASAAKRSDRAANEGVIVAYTTEDGKTAVCVEINCETDFVARNAEFEAYSKKVGEAMMSSGASSLEELMKVSVAGDTVEGLHNEILAKFSERVEIRRLKKYSTNGYFVIYLHAGSKLAVILEVSAAKLNEKALALVRDISMQIAAMNPQFIDRSQVDQATLDKEKEIYIQQAVDAGKKPEIAQKIAEGKLDKFYQENCLIEQSFVKDSNKNISDVLKEISAECGEEVKVAMFERIALGEITE